MSANFFQTRIGNPFLLRPFSFHRGDCEGRRLKTFAVDDAGSSLVELLLGNPHFLEGRERCQDGTADPDGVLPLGRSDDLDLHGGRSQGGDLLLHTIGDTGVHGGAAGEDGVGVEIFTDVDVALHDGVEAALVNADDFHTQEGRLEDGLGAAETLVADGDDLRGKEGFRSTRVITTTTTRQR